LGLVGITGCFGGVNIRPNVLRGPRANDMPRCKSGAPRTFGAMTDKSLQEWKFLSCAEKSGDVEGSEHANPCRLDLRWAHGARWGLGFGGCWVMND